MPQAVADQTSGSKTDASPSRARTMSFLAVSVAITLGLAVMVGLGLLINRLMS